MRRLVLGGAFSDLGRLYAADRNGFAAQLPAASPYRDYVAREAASADDAEARADEDYWAQQYADWRSRCSSCRSTAARPAIKTYTAAARAAARRVALHVR